MTLDLDSSSLLTLTVVCLAAEYKFVRHACRLTNRTAAQHVWWLLLTGTVLLNSICIGSSPLLNLHTVPSNDFTWQLKNSLDLVTPKPNHLTNHQQQLPSNSLAWPLNGPNLQIDWVLDQNIWVTVTVTGCNTRQDHGAGSRVMSPPPKIRCIYDWWRWRTAMMNEKNGYIPLLLGSCETE